MKSYISEMKKYLCLILMIVAAVAPAFAQTDYNPVIDNIARSYAPWESAEFSGKIKTSRLPVSPTVKIFMVRDSLIQISLRAPLLGEVGRVNMTTDTIVAVNKMNRTYVKEPTANLLDIYPNLIGDIQSLLLARVVVLGHGELKTEHSAIVEVEDDREGGYILIPFVEDNLAKFSYGYLIGSNSRTRALVADLPGSARLELTYGYRKGLQIGVDFERKGKKTEADIDFSTVRWGGKALSPLNLINYRRVSAKEFISSIR